MLRLVLMPLFLAVLSVCVPSSEPGFSGNGCGPDGNELCPVMLRQGGWPWPYVTEKPNIHAQGAIIFGPDDAWSGRTFALDAAFFMALLGGISAFRRHPAPAS